MLGIFFAAYFIYAGFDVVAIFALVVSLVVIPFLAWNDRIVFDGKRIRRTGLVPRVWCVFNGTVDRLKLSDIEQIETHALRALKRGGSVFYRYRTAVSGRGHKFVFASGGEEYRRMVRALFPGVSENVLDNRSIELRDYLGEPKEAVMKAEFMRIPSSAVLEETVDLFSRPANRSATAAPAGPDWRERVEYLRRLANELRLAGYLLQSIEVFRRAMLLDPNDPWLLFEASRGLHSYAGSERDSKLHKRAIAMLRLAERRAAGDRDLLARIGECFFQFGDWERAKRVFIRTLDQNNENFRALRGMAEISLREGKIAHVIHNFLAANRLAETPALRRWTQGEADYFGRLNSDENYMDMEISRINLLDTLGNSKKTSLKIAVVALPAILLGIVVEESMIANLGWAVAAVALLIWTGLTISLKLFGQRIPYELVEESE